VLIINSNPVDRISTTPVHWRIIINYYILKSYGYSETPFGIKSKISARTMPIVMDVTLKDNIC
jgi:hypothetical protein